MLFLITNRKLAQNKNFYKVIEEAISAGIYAVILREKDLSYELLLPIAVKIKEIIGNSGVKLIINNNIEVAKVINADGYHTNFISFIKERLSFSGTIGVSVHSLEEAMEAEEHGANYILLGHIFETDCKKGVPPKGIEFIKIIKNHINIPIISLGGIQPANAHLVMEAGSDGVAVMSSIMKAKDPYLLVSEYIISMRSFNH